MSGNKGVSGVVLACLFVLAVSAPASDTEPQANPISPPYAPPACLPGVVGQFPATNCQNFYSCNNGIITYVPCPPGELFDRVTKTCKLAIGVNCAAPAVVVVVPSNKTTTKTTTKSSISTLSTKPVTKSSVTTPSTKPTTKSPNTTSTTKRHLFL